MIEEQINDLIAKMVDMGFEFTSDDVTGVHFKTINGGDGRLVFRDWYKVDSFVTGQIPKLEEAYGKV